MELSAKTRTTRRKILLLIKRDLPRSTCFETVRFTFRQSSTYRAHNVKNALAVIAVSDLLGVSKQDMQKGFLSYKGTNRRFEHKGEVGGAKVIDDYAHHPTEVKATLKAARAVANGKKVWCVFQPHTYTRSLALKDEFAKSFFDCDGLVVTDIYAAREKDTGLITSADLVDVINKNSGNATYIKAFQDVADFFKERVSPGDLILTMGAGDVYKIGELLVK